jgi:hypothetical protein
VCLLSVSCTEEEARDRRKKAKAKEGTRRVPGYAGGMPILPAFALMLFFCCK